MGMRSVVVLDDPAPFKLRELIPFIGAIVTGAIGGCVASFQHVRNRKETVTAFVVSYAVTGAFGAIMAVAGAMAFYPDAVSGWSYLLILSGVAGVITSSAMAAGNISMRLILAKLGFEVEVTVKRSGGKRAETED